MNILLKYSVAGIYFSIFHFILVPKISIIDLKKILENGGAEITSYYKANSKLIDPLREALVALIIKGRELSRPMQNNLAEQICEIFPGESKVYIYKYRKVHFAVEL